MKPEAYRPTADVAGFLSEIHHHHHRYHKGPDFDDMSPIFPCEKDDAIQYINLGCGAQAPKIVILSCIFGHFGLFLSFRLFL